MIANITIYLPTSDLVKRFKELGFAPLIDTKNNLEHFFNTNYPNDNHRAFYLDPFLFGKVADINFKIMGKPDFIIWFTEREELDQEKWSTVAAYVNICINGGECPTQTITEAKVFLGTHVVPPCLVSPLPVESSDDVIVRDAKDNYYQFKDMYLEDDSALLSVCKPFVKDPFTLIIKDFSVVGYSTFFTDLFACKEWGNTYTDVQFLKQLWDELKMEGEFDIDVLLSQRTIKFFPDGVECPKVEPTVHRVSIEELSK
jgi:hypothetical protein